jgi:glutamate synthase domain-containing protein 1
LARGRIPGDHGRPAEIARLEAEAYRVCGIVGLLLRDRALEPELGRLTAAMLHEMRGRGPDSTGIPVYGAGEEGTSKLCAVAHQPATVYAWSRS